MSHTRNLTDMVMFIGIVMLLVSQIYPGANANWSAFVTEISNPPTVPGGNPLALNTKTVTLPIVGNGSWGYSSVTSTFGNPAVSPSAVFNATGTPCGQGAHVSGGVAYPGQYWNCLTTKDGQSSGVNLAGLAFVDLAGILHNGYNMVLQLGNISGIDMQNQVVNVTISAECNSNANNITFIADLLQTRTVLGQWPNPSSVYPNALSIAHAEFMGNKKCEYGGAPPPWGGHWSNVTLVSNFQNGIYVSSQRLQNFTGAQLLITTNGWATGLQISYISVVISYLDENSSSINANCNNLDPLTGVACTLSKAWDAFAGFLTVAVLFVSGWIVWGVSIFVDFLVGFFGSIVWFMNPANTHMPVIIQSVVDLIMVVSIVSLIMTFVQIVRGVR